MKEKDVSSVKKAPLRFFSRHHARGQYAQRGVKSSCKGIFSSTRSSATPKTERKRSSSPAAKSKFRQTLEKLAQQQQQHKPPMMKYDKRDEEEDDALAEINNNNNNNNNDLCPDNASRKSSPSGRKPSSPQMTTQATCDDSHESANTSRDLGGILNEHGVEEKSAARERGCVEMEEAQEEEEPKEIHRQDIGDELIVYGVESAYADPVDCKCPTMEHYPQSCSTANQITGFEIATAELLKQQQEQAQELVNIPEPETPIHSFTQPLQQQEKTQQLGLAPTVHVVSSSLLQQQEEKQPENSNGSVESQQEKSQQSGFSSNSEESAIRLVESQQKETKQRDVTSSDDSIRVVELEPDNVAPIIHENSSPKEITHAVAQKETKPRSAPSRSTKKNKSVLSEVILRGGQGAVGASDLVVSIEISPGAQDTGAIEKNRAAKDLMSVEDDMPWGGILIKIVGLAEKPIWPGGSCKLEKVNNSGGPMKPCGKLSKIDPSLTTSAICSPDPPQTRGNGDHSKELLREEFRNMQNEENSSVEVSPLHHHPMVYIEGMVESLRPKTAGYPDWIPTFTGNTSVAEFNPVFESDITKQSACSSITSTAVTAKIGHKSAKVEQKNKPRSTHVNVKENRMCVLQPQVSYLVAPTNLEALSLLTRCGNSGTEGFLKNIKKIPVASGIPPSEDPIVRRLVGNLDTMEGIPTRLVGPSQQMEESSNPENTTSLKPDNKVVKGTNGKIVTSQTTSDTLKASVSSNDDVCSQYACVGIADSASAAATSTTSVSNWFQKLLLGVTKKDVEPVPTNHKLGQQTENMESMVSTGWESIIKACDKICDETCLPTPETRELVDVIDSESVTASGKNLANWFQKLCVTKKDKEPEPTNNQLGQQTENMESMVSTGWESIVKARDKICDETCLPTPELGDVIDSESATASVNFFGFTIVAATSPEKTNCELEQASIGAKLNGNNDNNEQDSLPLAGHDQELSRVIVHAQTDSEIQYSAWTATPNITDHPATGRRTMYNSTPLEIQEAADTIEAQLMEAYLVCRSSTNLHNSPSDSEIQHKNQASSLSSSNMVQPFNQPTGGSRVDDSVQGTIDTELNETNHDVATVKTPLKDESVLLSARRTLWDAGVCHLLDDKTILNGPITCISLLEKYAGSFGTLSGEAATDDATNAGDIVGRCESRLYNSDFCSVEEQWSRLLTFQTDSALESIAGLSMEENTTNEPRHDTSFDNCKGAEVVISVEVELAEERDETNCAPLKSESNDTRKEETRTSSSASSKSKHSASKKSTATAKMPEKRTGDCSYFDPLIPAVTTSISSQSQSFDVLRPESKSDSTTNYTGTLTSSEGD